MPVYIKSAGTDGRRYRTQAPLSFPPHVITLSAIYTCALLSLEHNRHSNGDGKGQEAMDDAEEREMAHMLGTEGIWEKRYHASADSVDG